MLVKKYATQVLSVSALASFLLVQTGCGEDPGLYQNESLSFENPQTEAVASKEEQNLDLGADESSDFRLLGGYPLVPYVGSPLYDYYTRPLAVSVPVSPVATVVDYVHPFYAYRSYNPFFWGFDDDDGRPYGNRGHRRHHRR